MLDITYDRCHVNCPCCGHSQSITMDYGASPQVYVCDLCLSAIAAPAGECCLFCAYGSKFCEPKSNALKTPDNAASDTLLIPETKSGYTALVDRAD